MNDLTEFASKMGRKGGNATYKRYGKEYYQKIGAISAEKRNKKRLEKAKIEVKVDEDLTSGC